MFCFVVLMCSVSCVLGVGDVLCVISCCFSSDLFGGRSSFFIICFVG